MALRQIRIQGDEVLEKVCRPVEKISPRIATLIEDMIETMYENEGWLHLRWVYFAASLLLTWEKDQLF